MVLTLSQSWVTLNSKFFEGSEAETKTKNSHKLQHVVSLQSVRFCWLKDVTYIIHFWHGWSCRSALVALHHSGEGGATWAFWWGNGRLKPSPVLTTWNPPNTWSRIYIIICLSKFEFWFCFIFYIILCVIFFFLNVRAVSGTVWQWQLTAKTTNMPFYHGRWNM